MSSAEEKRYQGEPPSHFYGYYGDDPDRLPKEAQPLLAKLVTEPCVFDRDKVRWVPIDIYLRDKGLVDAGFESITGKEAQAPEKASPLPAGYLSDEELLKEVKRRQIEFHKEFNEARSAIRQLCQSLLDEGKIASFNDCFKTSDDYQEIRIRHKRLNAYTR